MPSSSLLGRNCSNLEKIIAKRYESRGKSRQVAATITMDISCFSRGNRILEKRKKKRKERSYGRSRVTTQTASDKKDIFLSQ